MSPKSPPFPMPRACALLGAFLVAVACVPLATASDPGAAVLSPRLMRAVEARPASADSEARLAVWVYFDEAVVDPAEEAAAMAAAEANLTERALRRRMKMLAPGSSPVDRRDLPLDRDRVAAAAATGAVLRRESRWLRAASFDATPEEVRALAALPGVRRVDLVGKTAPLDRGTARPVPSSPLAAGAWSIDYGSSLETLELINVPLVHELGYTGEGVVVAMMDTGFRMTHEALAHIPVVAAWDFVGDDPVVDTEAEDPEGSHSHGTQVVSTIMGYAPGHIVGSAFGASAILVRAEEIGVESLAEEDYWVAGLEWAEGQGADLVSSSIGSWSLHTADEFDGDTIALSIAADLAASRGLLVVCGAGNQGGTDFDVIVSPSDGDSVLAVGAVDDAGAHASWSSTGPTADGRTKPDVAARGENVPAADPADDAGYVLNGGTSFSGPIAAGVAALMLQRAPFLTPMEIREALRETASRHDAPDTLIGWGVIDAVAAVHYWGPRFAHDPLGNTEDPTGPFAVTATVTDPYGLDGASLRLRHRVDGGDWQEAALLADGSDAYSATIPGRDEGATFEYYLEASDVRGLTTRHPFAGSADPFRFVAAADGEHPVIAHRALRDQPLGSWPPGVVAAVTDDVGVDVVTLSFTINGGAESGAFPMTPGDGDAYVTVFPLAADQIVDGDTIAYTITARDASAAGNETRSGPHSFTVHAGLGRVLVIDDTGGSGEAATAAGWLTGAGYDVTAKATSALVPADFTHKDAVVLLSGSNEAPLESATLRGRVESWVAGGGPLLIEGGESAFIATTFPGYPSFAADVIHLKSWEADGGGALIAAEGEAAHPLLMSPMTVTPPVVVSGGADSDQDAVIAAPEARHVLEHTVRTGTAGAIVYDAVPDAPGGSVVYLAFALAALADPDQAHALVLNGMHYLLSGGGLTPVRLLAFRAVRRGSDAVLSWAVADAVDHLGFHVHREDAGGDRVRLTDALLTGGNRYAFVDAEPPAGPAAYWLAEVSRTGAVTWHGPAVLAAAPWMPIARAVPNPARADASIRYMLAADGPVAIRIFDAAGRLVREVAETPQTAGNHGWTWDRRDDAGMPVRVGIYFFTVAAGETRRSGKLTLVR